MAKNTGDIRLLRPELVLPMRKVYILIKNRNELLQAQRYTLGTVDWKKYPITISDGSQIMYPEWLKMNTDEAMKNLEMLKNALEKELE